MFKVPLNDLSSIPITRGVNFLIWCAIHFFTRLVILNFPLKSFVCSLKHPYWIFSSFLLQGHASFTKVGPFWRQFLSWRVFGHRVSVDLRFTFTCGTGLGFQFLCDFFLPNVQSRHRISLSRRDVLGPTSQHSTLPDSQLHTESSFLIWGVEASISLMLWL